MMVSLPVSEGAVQRAVKEVWTKNIGCWIPGLLGGEGGPSEKEVGNGGIVGE